MCWTSNATDDIEHIDTHALERRLAGKDAATLCWHPQDDAQYYVGANNRTYHMWQFASVITSETIEVKPVECVL